MEDRPQTWHDGLMARWWAEFNTAKPVERAFSRGFFARDGHPALDLACGTGRLLLPLLRAGLDIDGCDRSPDMLTHGRAQATREGLAPQLYAPAMHLLDLPRPYRTIAICDSFALGGQRAHDAEALRRCYRHPAPGGVLIFRHSFPYGNGEEWEYWQPHRRRELPREWSAPARRQGASGDEYAVRSRLVDLDPLAQRATREVEVLRYRAGHLVAEERGRLAASLSFHQELLRMLEAAGFPEVSVQEGDTGRAVTAEETMPISIARKGSPRPATPVALGVWLSARP
jgi:SAM-dependent methyltransferase